MMEKLSALLGGGRRQHCTRWIWLSQEWFTWSPVIRRGNAGREGGREGSRGSGRSPRGSPAAQFPH